MYLRCHVRRKDGKEHRDWSIEEKRRCADGRAIDRRVLYLGELNDSQQARWLRCLEVLAATPPTWSHFAITVVPMAR
jgi:hypothetical protein